MERSRPYVILSAAITLDGKLGISGKRTKLSSKSDKIRVHKLRSKVDAIIIGKNTVTHDNPLLTVRHVKGKNPIRIILDSLGTVKSNSKIIQTCNQVPTIIAVSEAISKQNLKRLQKFPLEIIICGKNRVNISKLLKILLKNGIRKIVLEGGGTTNWSFLKQNKIDEAIITLTPYILGGKNTISLVEGIGFKNISTSTKLKLKKIQKNRNELVLFYKL
jgi:2,5-diamino-6-(ribosylamino)-4(3H)-pyrimidinone 5'-phosphate reductase